MCIPDLSLEFRFLYPTDLTDQSPLDIKEAYPKPNSCFSTSIPRGHLSNLLLLQSSSEAIVIFDLFIFLRHNMQICLTGLSASVPASPESFLFTQ